MPREPYSTNLTDAAWVLIAPLLPAARTGGRPRTTDLRAVVNAIFYLLRTGCQWRLLPREFPAWGTVYHYFRTWQNTGVWTGLHRTIYEQARKQAGRSECPSVVIMERPVGKDHRARRRSWLRWTQAREGPEAAHPRRYLGTTDRQPSGTGQHIGAPRWCSLARWPQPSIPEDTDRYR